MLESAYEKALIQLLVNRGLDVRTQVPISVVLEGVLLGEGFRADVIVENKIIIEIKSVEEMKPVFAKQLKTYLVLSNMKLGLLINYGQEFLKDGIKRVVNHLDE